MSKRKGLMIAIPNFIILTAAVSAAFYGVDQVSGWWMIGLWAGFGIALYGLTLSPGSNMIPGAPTWEEPMWVAVFLLLGPLLPILLGTFLVPFAFEEKENRQYEFSW